MMIRTRLFKETALKTLTFAALHFVVGFAVSYAFTGSVIIAGGIALVEPAVNTVVFYFHEMAWASKAKGPRGYDGRGHGHGFGAAAA